MKLIVIVIAAIASVNASTVPSSSSRSCRFAHRDDENVLRRPEPLCLVAGGEEFIPLVKGKMKLEHDQKMDVFCDKGFKANHQGAKFEVTCKNGQLKKGSENFDYSVTECKEWASAKAKEITGAAGLCNKGKGRLYRIGFEVDTQRFVTVYTSCHDAPSATNFYSHYEIKSALSEFSSRINFGEHAWRTGGLFKSLQVTPSDADDLFSPRKVRAQLGDILRISAKKNGKSNPAYEAYNNNNVYLNRGHLAAKADFARANEQHATYMLANAAPQWNTFNGENWERVERTSRALASRGFNLEVYTGTVDTLKLWKHPGSTNIRKKPEDYLDIFIAPRATPLSKGQMPVPLYFFKILVEEGTNNGVVLIGVNDPYMEESRFAELMREENRLCKDVSGEIIFFGFMGIDNGQAKGYTFACSVKDFMKKGVYIESLKNVELTDRVKRDWNLGSHARANTGRLPVATAAAPPVESSSKPQQPPPPSRWSQGKPKTT